MLFRRKIFLCTLLSLGFTSLTFQIVILREMLVIFSGSELSIGIILSNWLILVGMGSWASGYFVDKLKDKEKTFLSLQLSVTLILPLEIYAIRILRPLIQKTPTEMVGLPSLILFSFFVLSVICILFGIWFVLASRIFAQTLLPYEGERLAATPIGESYAFESSGSIIGGLMTSFLLIRYFNSLQIAFILSGINLLILVLLVLRSHPRSSILSYLYSSLFVLVIVLILSGKINELDRFSKTYQWKPFNLVESKNSIYGNISVIRVGDQYSFYESGSMLFSSSEGQYNEELVHFTLLTHKDPKKVLLIGGGISGSLDEILKHPIERVVYVELDPVLIDLGKKFGGRENASVLEDSRVTISYGDGRFYVKKSKERFDCVIVDMPDPCTGLVNRFYTLEFFQEIKNILKDDGILTLSLTSLENYMSEELKLLSSTVYRTLREVFKSSIVIPGMANYFLASPKENSITLDPERFVSRMDSRKVSLTYLTPYYTRYLLREERLQRVMSWIKEKKEVKINRDSYPVCYFYGLLFWGSYFGRGIPLLLSNLRNMNLGWIIGVILALLLIFMQVRWRKYWLRKFSLLSIMMITAFTGMLLELAIIFIFQMTYGYLYYRLGLLITFCMAGIAFGSFLSVRFFLRGSPFSKGRGIISVILIAEIGLFVYALVLPLISIVHLFLLFPLCTFFAGLPIGLVFPLANQLFLELQPLVGKTTGRLYGCDLWGATLGAFLGTVIFIPIFGIVGTCLITGAVTGVGILLLLRTYWW